LRRYISVLYIIQDFNITFIYVSGTSKREVV